MLIAGWIEREASGPIHRSLENLSLSGSRLCLATQSLYEFWSVVTRPVSSNGFDLAPTDAREAILNFRRDYFVLPEPLDLIDRWLALCTRYAVLGRPSHDARLVAVADAHGIERILTLNSGHFARFSHLKVETP